jgi:uncharacterized membrane protein YhaH (DUF805 family)
MEPKAVIDTFVNVVTKRYVDFQGRARRQEFWYFFLAVFVLGFLVGIVQQLLGLGYALSSLLSLALLLPNLGLSVRRLHDTNRSGWWLLLILIPILGWLALLYFYVEAGTSGSNTYGADPKA